jgi:tRNA (guanine-N7-)-methyltransferase
MRSMDPNIDSTARRRTIRSFVRRAGRLTASQQRALDELWPQFGVAFGAAALRFDELFGRAAPVVLEIGFGNGETLVQQAAEHPACDFLGVEVHEPGIGHCLIKAREAGVTNLRLIRHDAVEVLDTMIPPASLARVNLYFPDPWPKKRHHKRRIVQLPFLDLVADRLAPGGTFNVATDWENYAEDIEAKVRESGRFRCAEQRVHGGDQPLDRPGTKFERRGLRHGHRIRDWRFVHVDDGPGRLASREL